MNKKLKICHIGWAHSMHVKRITQWFARKSHDISIITNNPQEIDGIKVYECYIPPNNSLCLIDKEGLDYYSRLLQKQGVKQ